MNDDPRMAAISPYGGAMEADLVRRVIALERVQRAPWSDVQFASATDQDLLEAGSSLVSVTFAPPANATEVKVMASGVITHSTQTTVDLYVIGVIRIDGVDSPEFFSGGPSYAPPFFSERIDIACPATFGRTVTLSSPGASVVVQLRGDVSEDASNPTADAALTAFAVASAFV